MKLVHAITTSAAMCSFFCAFSTHAAVLATTPDGAILLHDDKGSCVGQARRAEWRGPEGSVGGCWVVRGAAVFVLFFDGDYAAIPAAALTKPKEG